MNRDEQRRRLEAESRVAELEAQLLKEYEMHDRLRSRRNAFRDERDALWMRCQNYRLGGARTGDEWDALIAERDRLQQWNNAVAVCERHTGKIIGSGCYVCIAEAFEQENERLREALQRIVDVDYRGYPSTEQGIARAALGK